VWAAGISDCPGRGWTAGIPDRPGRVWTAGVSRRGGYLWLTAHVLGQQGASSNNWHRSNRMRA
jgi:hypothetical protein